MPRIVSLIASATEIVHALGREGELVGRSHECDFPATVKCLPVCTEPAFDANASSREIDQRVKTVLQDALSVYRVNRDILKNLRPDLILTQSLCDVCAVSLADVEKALNAFLDYRPRIVSLAAATLEDVWLDIVRVADSLGCPGRSDEVVSTLRKRMDAIRQRTMEFAYRPSVVCVEWIDPLMAAGNWTPELVETAGGLNLFGTAGQHSGLLDWLDVRKKDPEIVVVSPCGFDIKRTREEMPVLTRLEGWHDLHAIRKGRVHVADGNQFFNRPGPRLVETLEILAEIIHPDVFSFGHEGKDWQCWSARE